MKRLTVLIFCLVVILFANKAQSMELKGKVSDVVMGDIVILTDFDGGQGENLLKVKMCGVKVPDISLIVTADHKLHVDAEPYADKAYMYFAMNLLGNGVDIEITGIDDNGDLVGIVYENGVNVNLEVLGKGLGKLDAPTLPEEASEDFYDLERYARVNEIGLWKKTNTAYTEMQMDHGGW